MRSVFRKAWPSRRDESGIVIIVAMVFIMIFLIIGMALYWLIAGEIRSTDTERSTVKAVNVAEAGIDAGMLTLKLDWPKYQSTTPVTVDDADVKKLITTNTSIQKTLGLWDPTNPLDFIQVKIYDNVDASGHTTTVPYPNAPPWDSNHNDNNNKIGDGIMFVDSTGNVGNDRHRIVVAAKKTAWDIEFPRGLALLAHTVSNVGASGPSMSLAVEGPRDGDVGYAIGGLLDKTRPIDAPDMVAKAYYPSMFGELVDPKKQALKDIAMTEGTYWHNGVNASNPKTAKQYLETGPKGKVVYIQNDTAGVTLMLTGGSPDVGTRAEPVTLVMDTPDTVSNYWGGNRKLYGIIITFGGGELQGAAGIYGAVYCSGNIISGGNGAIPEITYDQEVINNINRQSMLTVSMVPNTWQEYTLPSSPPSS